MDVVDLADIEGRTYPARRLTQNLVGGASSVKADQFAMGYVALEPDGGQVPWHDHPQEEVYVILEGRGEMCVGEQRRIVTGVQAVKIPSGVYHQLTNVGQSPLRMIYCYGPAGEVEHWKQELRGTLPRAGEEAPSLPDGARPQCTDPPENPPEI